MDDPAFTKLLEYLTQVPAVGGAIGTGATGEGEWWVKLTIDIDDALAWHVIQEFGHVMNYLSVEEGLPTVFKPVSPPPYLNGGPREFLSWVIECDDPSFRPGTLADWLKGRLPRPVADRSAWDLVDEEDEEGD